MPFDVLLDLRLQRLLQHPSRALTRQAARWRSRRKITALHQNGERPLTQ
ncbi:MAG: hypothetical protein IT374_27170 [Polyangiaceae bacterium]|nr:hypothetical protein [Polyangiaceae bacterium]